MRLAEISEAVARGFEVVGVVTIFVGGVVALISGARDFEDGDKFFKDVRSAFARPLLLGLEILVAADIMETVTVDSSLESVIVLGILVLIRIGLSFSLDVESDGVAPWSKTVTDMKMKVARDNLEQQE